MKNKIRMGTLMLYIGVMGLGSCKKYDDGPGISFHTRKGRVDGEWTAKTATMNGKDFKNQTFPGSYYSTSCSATYSYTETINVTKWEWNFSKKGDFTYSLSYNYKYFDDVATDVNCSTTYGNQSGTDVGNGTWKFNDDKTKITLTYVGNTQIFSLTATEIYEIKELRNKEMKLFGTIDGDLITVVLEQ